MHVEGAGAECEHASLAMPSMGLSPATARHLQLPPDTGQGTGLQQLCLGLQQHVHPLSSSSQGLQQLNPTEVDQQLHSLLVASGAARPGHLVLFVLPGSPVGVAGKAAGAAGGRAGAAGAAGVAAEGARAAGNTAGSEGVATSPQLVVGQHRHAWLWVGHSHKGTASDDSWLGELAVPALHVMGHSASASTGEF